MRPLHFGQVIAAPPFVARVVLSSQSGTDYGRQAQWGMFIFLKKMLNGRMK
jgi:hypothetical protein